MTRSLFLASQTPAVIQVTGSDARDFLHRMSTNEVINCEPSECFFNCFTNDKGRMVAFVEHQPSTSKNKCILHIEPGHAQKLVDHLNNFLFAEDVAIGIQKELVFPSDAGTHPNFPQHRIDNNIPAAGHEIVEAYNPLELGLKDCISFSKGCYIGQEVIARLDTYDKVRRQLLPFKISDDEFSALTVGSKIEYDNQMGIITSVAPEYHPNHFQGLAVFSLKKSK